MINFFQWPILFYIALLLTALADVFVEISSYTIIFCQWSKFFYILPLLIWRFCRKIIRLADRFLQGILLYHSSSNCRIWCTSYLSYTSEPRESPRIFKCLLCLYMCMTYIPFFFRKTPIYSGKFLNLLRNKFNLLDLMVFLFVFEPCY